MEKHGGEHRYMILHTFSGITQPYYPKDFHEALKEVAHKIRAQPGDVVLGLNGPGTVPATLLALQLGLPVCYATKASLARSPKLKFREPGSPRSDTFVYYLRSKMSVILVDDDITTGNALRSCIETLRSASVEIRAVVVTVESTAVDGANDLRREGTRVFSLGAHALSSAK